MTDDINEKLDKFSSILEKFGLDIITKMGQTNLKINQLTDKVNQLSKATLDVKALSPQLGNIIESQKLIEKEIDLLKSLISNLKDVSPAKIEENIERNETATNKKDLIISELNKLKSNLQSIGDPIDVKVVLAKIKEDIFEFTGGHRMLYDISQVINRLASAKTLDEQNDPNESNKTLTNFLDEKITFWMNKLMVKD